MHKYRMLRLFGADLLKEHKTHRGFIRRSDDKVGTKHVNCPLDKSNILYDQNIIDGSTEDLSHVGD